MKRWIVQNMLRWLVKNTVSMGGTVICGNRYTRTLAFNGVEIDITFRHTTEPDSYSREELYRMLRIIRDQEQATGWKVPEPVQP